MATPSSTPSLAGREQRQTIRFMGSTAVVAALFLLLIGGGLLFEHWRVKTNEPLKSPALAAAKLQLRQEPANEPLKEKIRALDFELRQKYFRHSERTATGRWLLAAGFVVFLLAAQRAVQLRQPPYLPRGTAAEGSSAPPMVRRSRLVVGVMAGFFVAAGLVTALSVTSMLSPTRTGEGGSAAGPAALPVIDPAEWQQNWPLFRGPGGDGIALATNYPADWYFDPADRALWKTPIPLPGFNSPIVWDDRVFLSGAEGDKRAVMCFDAQSGQLLWDKPIANVPGSPAELPEIPEQTGFAAPTMATDGQRAFAIFANGDLAACDFNGNIVWSKNLGVPVNPHGHASSLAVWQNRLIVQYDQGDAEEGKSRLFALDTATGRTLWQQRRAVPSSWSTPLVLTQVEKPAIITLAVPWVMAYGCADGAELWRVECLGGEVTPSPVFAAGRLFVVSPSEKFLALRPDGRGDVTKSHVVWTNEEYAPDITSPVCNGELLFSITTHGMLVCLDAKEGSKVWEHDFAEDFNASPTLLGERLYLINNHGRVLVLKAGRQFQQLAQVELGEPVWASPAFARGKVFIRSAKHLFAFAPAAKPRLASHTPSPTSGPRYDN